MVHITESRRFSHDSKSFILKSVFATMYICHIGSGVARILRCWVTDLVAFTEVGILCKASMHSMLILRGSGGRPPRKIDALRLNLGIFQAKFVP